MDWRNRRETGRSYLVAIDGGHPATRDFKRSSSKSGKRSKLLDLITRRLPLESMSRFRQHETSKEIEGVFGKCDV